MKNGPEPYGDSYERRLRKGDRYTKVGQVMAVGVIPVGYRVLVERIENRDVGAIAMPDNSTSQGIRRYKVVAKGESRITANGREVPITVNIGDEIMFDMRHFCECGPKELFDGRELGTVDVDALLAVFVNFKDKPITPKPRAATQAETKQLVH